jgi:hypothetical protein
LLARDSRKHEGFLEEDHPAWVLVRGGDHVHLYRYWANRWLIVDSSFGGISAGKQMVNTCRSSLLTNTP